MGNGNGQYLTIFLSISIDESYPLSNCKTISIRRSLSCLLRALFHVSVKDLFAEYTQFLIYLRNT